MTSTLHSCLKLLNQHCDRLNNTYKEILEIRTCIAEILAKSQSEVAIGNTGAWGRSSDLSFGDEPLTIAPTALNEFDANSFLSTPPNLGHSLLPQPLLFLNGQPSAQEYGSLAPSSVGVGNTLPEGTDPTVYQVSQQSLLTGASGSVSFELGTQSFQKFLAEDDTSEEQTLSGPSVGYYHRQCLPIVRDGEDKVKCMWSGCSGIIRKDSYTRHVNEVHKRLIKAICTTCGKKFPRPYMKKTHICPSRDSKHSSS
ncbi:hypothetical protein CY34DRAFT_106594 [Suillus luteus UH-Slu-Lm8-n1]|uniref:Uncharacterized protein n=1 Tax=Suillus luteus UH-Slu-Lm8-n1 TaxID=930992 RepID=A0A0D0B9Q6_9AGAM|nr:hypothetical protein CY34DRAFT_106594 [Suillus luteus UH-Slu-Lm8-n1]